MATRQLSNDEYSKTFDQFGKLVKNKRPVYTIVKHDPVNYDLINFYTKQVYLSSIPFKLTAERLMDKLNRGVVISQDLHRRFQEACNRYHGLAADRPFLEIASTSKDFTKRRVAQARLDLVDARIAAIEDFLFIDDK